MKYYIIDNYAGTIEGEFETPDTAKKVLDAMQAESGIFVWSILEAENKEALIVLLIQQEAKREQSEQEDQKFLEGLQQTAKSLLEPHKAFRHSYDVTTIGSGNHVFYYHADCVQRNPPEPPTLFEEIELASVPQDTPCSFCDEPMHGKSGYELQAEWKVLNAKYGPPEEPEESTETRAIKALVEDVFANNLESTDASAVDDFGRAGGCDRQAEALEKALTTLYNITIEEDENEPEIIHVFTDFRKPWKDFDLANWQWVELESERKES